MGRQGPEEIPSQNNDTAHVIDFLKYIPRFQGLFSSSQALYYSKK